MALQLQFAALLGFAGLMVLAAIEDLRRLMIPNVLTLSLCLLWPLYMIATPSLFGTLGSLSILIERTCTRYHRPLPNTSPRG